MNDRHRITVSKYISKHLRHASDTIGLTLGDGGWVTIDDLIMASGKHGFPITPEELEHVVATCEKQRFAIDPTGQLIRANQGHSVEVELHLEPITPPDVLYHGTAVHLREPLLATGLLKMRRQHVHLSADIPTALAVGQRHGRPILFAVDTMSMSRDGYVFYRAANGVWLTDHVPPRYLRELTQE